jgi:hypothetical protein
MRFPHGKGVFARLTRCSNMGIAGESSATEAILARAGERESPMLSQEGKGAEGATAPETLRPPDRSAV